MGSHFALVWTWIALANFNTINSHCGYDFPWFHRGSSREHDFHHEKFNYCYGVLGALDWYYNTDSLFYKRYGGSSVWEKLFGVSPYATKKNVKTAGKEE
jgi:sterol desaturase/sphingolipid hydroxylase (fatty acid hydroxylase superfamily)